MKRRAFLKPLLFAPFIIRTPGLLMPIKSLASEHASEVTERAREVSERAREGEEPASAVLMRPPTLADYWNQVAPLRQGYRWIDIVANPTDDPGAFASLGWTIVYEDNSP